jgi:hypothetical protein
MIRENVNLLLVGMLGSVSNTLNSNTPNRTMKTTITLTERELLLILHGLSYLQDQDWFFDNKDELENLINRLDVAVDTAPQNIEAICDI